MKEIQAIEEFERLKKQWYMSDPVVFEMVKCMKYRESVFINRKSKNVQRMLKINAVRFLYKNFERYDFFEQDNLFNVYHSVATIPDMPMSSFNLNKKREQMSKFNIDYENMITKYDLFIDLDNPDFELVYSSAVRLKRIFDDYKIKYSLVYSGTKGFHFTVRYDDFPDKLKQIPIKRLCRIFKLFAYELKIVHKIKDLDVTVFDLRRIMKVPYSVVYPYYRVALPLSDEQFNNFNLDMVSLATLIFDVDNIKNRGVLIRQGDPNGLYQLIEDTAIKRKNIDKLFKIMKINRKTLYDELNKRS